MKRVVLILSLITMFLLGACSMSCASAEQTWPLKIWHQNDNGAMHTYCVVDDDTGVTTWLSLQNVEMASIRLL